MNKFENFCYKHEHWGIRNLMTLIAIGTVSVHFLAWLFSDAPVIEWMILDPQAVMAGQFWRLLTFVFVPLTNNVVFLLLACYFYHWIGKTLESEWGRLKFNIFYLTGMIGTIAFSMLTNSYSTADYLNMSLFFAFASLFPEHKIMLFFIIPIKVKYLAAIEAAVFLIIIAFNMPIFPYNLLPLIALLNYLLYFWRSMLGFFKRNTAYSKKRVDFKTAVRQSQSRPGYQGYVHKCSACGLTDTQDPNTEFRYCSLCAHYECYCSQHIFTHDHIKE